ncbi:XRE family transcriptional regulator [Frankia sp. CiP1_Cm_nod1]|uniref:XRE family transcriptional regulator n=1 Tax=Frankia sp. CiP1_Cm_nod1 TaxID=2897160 RepID=UPI00202473D3
MSGRTAAGWHTYEDTGELLAELDLDDADMTRAREVAEDHIRAWHLAQVRAEQDRTQSDLAAAMGVSQPRVSALERGELDSVTISTLRAYVSALGGKLRIVADFGDREYRLT